MTSDLTPIRSFVANKIFVRGVAPKRRRGIQKTKTLSKSDAAEASAFLKSILAAEASYSEDIKPGVGRESTELDWKAREKLEELMREEEEESKRGESARVILKWIRDAIINKDTQYRLAAMNRDEAKCSGKRDCVSELPTVWDYHDDSEFKRLDVSNSDPLLLLWKRMYGFGEELIDTIDQYVQDSGRLTGVTRLSETDWKRKYATESWADYKSKAAELEAYLETEAPRLTVDTLVWRGVSKQYPLKMKENTFSGWSRSPNTARAFAGPDCCLYRLLLPKGTRALDTLTIERELIIGKHEFKKIGQRTYLKSPDSPDTISTTILELVK